MSGASRVLRVLTDVPKVPATLVVDGIEFRFTRAATSGEFFRLSKHCDFVLINSVAPHVYTMMLANLLRFWARKPVVVQDLVMRVPYGLKQRLLALGRRWILRGVDLFIHYFKDLKAYQRYFGIDAARSAYTPFKSNLRDVVKVRPGDMAEDYVLTLGASMRDYENFISAMAGLDIPAVLPAFGYFRCELRSRMKQYTTPAELPPNVRIQEDDGSDQSLYALMSKARIVVVSTYADSICASGLGTYMNAMWLGKAVVMCDGPGASDVLTDQAVIVPPGDPQAMAAAIDELWRNDAKRREYAARGHAYAESLGGERELLERLLRLSVSRVPALSRAR